MSMGDGFNFEPWLRVGSFAAVLLLMVAAETFHPRRRYSQTRLSRWSNNLGLAVLNTLSLRLIFPLTAVQWALYCESQGWGLLNRWALAPGWTIVTSLLVLDWAIYWQHRLFHVIPVFWRLHRLHHTDLDIDTTTAIRFHPLEMLLSMALKMMIIVTLGAPAITVLLFEVLLNASAMFNHANFYLPPRLDRALRWILVTPDMHRVHHSILREETDSNFGFNLPWWDRLFGSYREQPAAGHEAMTIGLKEFRDPRQLAFGYLLIQPFRSIPGKSPPSSSTVTKDQE